MQSVLADSARTAAASLAAALVLCLLTRLMGKKQIAQLSFFDYAVGISIGSVAAAVSVDSRIPLFSGIVSMAVWAALPLCFSSLSLGSVRARRLLDGSPVILMQDGLIVAQGLRRAKFTVNDLLEELRYKDIYDISEVLFAILETNGRLSVLKKPGQSGGGEFFANVIIDGEIMPGNLSRIGLDEKWLAGELSRSGAGDPGGILLAVCDRQRRLRVYRRADSPQPLDVLL